MADEAIEKDNFKLPLPPWTVENLTEELYCEVATRLGFFNPKTERPDFRPPLDCGPYLDQIRADNAPDGVTKTRGKKSGDDQPA